MKIVIASDSFKGCLSSGEVARAAAAGIRKSVPGCEIAGVKVSDGGEGLMEAMVSGVRDVRWEKASAHDPLGRPVTAQYAVIEGDTAIIESAVSIGLTLLSPAERNPLTASGRGLGEMIMDAAGKGLRKFIIGLGGSATCDGGTGMLSALGFRFTGIGNSPVEECNGQSLCKIRDIDDSSVPKEILDSAFMVACDVDNPFCGDEGAARVFAPQKGAGPEMVDELEKGMCNLADIISRKYGIDLRQTGGSGAAGGLAGAFLLLPGGRIMHGIDLMLDTIHFGDMIQGADLVITGEGRIDSQTPHGKVPSGVLRRAREKGVPAVAICGQLIDYEIVRKMGFKDIIPVTPAGLSLSMAMDPDIARRNIEAAMELYFSDHAGDFQ